MKLIAEQKVHTHTSKIKIFFFSCDFWRRASPNKKKGGGGSLFPSLHEGKKDWRYHETQPMTCNNSKLFF